MSGFFDDDDDDVTLTKKNKEDWHYILTQVANGYTVKVDNSTFVFRSFNELSDYLKFQFAILEEPTKPESKS